MTPEQADAKALNGGKGLRAEDSFYTGTTPDQRRAMAALVNTQRNMALPTDPNVMTQGVDGVTGAGQRYPGRAMVPQGRAAPVVDGRAIVPTDAGRAFNQGPTNLGRDANTIYQGTNTSGRFDLATRPIDPNVIDVESKTLRPTAATAPPMGPNAGPSNAEARGYKFGKNAAGAIRSTAGRAIPIVSGGFDVAQGIEQRDGWQVAKGAGDMVAGAALATPFAPAAGLRIGVLTA